LNSRPGAKIDTLKKLRILIRYAKDDLKWITTDPSEGIKRGKSKEIRAWSDAEMKAFEETWPFGTKQRAAYELMLNVGTARVDTHLITWVQADADDLSTHVVKRVWRSSSKKLSRFAQPLELFLASMSAF
jgi:hypothetical protein